MFVVSVFATAEGSPTRKKLTKKASDDENSGALVLIIILRKNMSSYVTAAALLGEWLTNQKLLSLGNSQNKKTSVGCKQASNGQQLAGDLN